MPDTAQCAIINTALSLMGMPSVADLSEASLRQNAAATKLMANFDNSYSTVLRRHGWLCALTYVCLPAAVIAGDSNWKYPAKYLLPGGALRVWEVRDPGPQIPFEEIDWLSFGMLGPPLIQGVAWEVNTIDAEAGASQLVVRSSQTCGLALSYVRRCNFSALDGHVADAVGYDVAARCAWNITGDRGVAKDLAAEAEKKVMLAISVDGTQEGGQAPLAPSITSQIRAMSR